MSLINFMVLHFLTFLNLTCYGVLFLLSIQSTCLKCYFTQFSKRPSRPGPPILHALPSVTLHQPYWPHVPKLYLAQRVSQTCHTCCRLTVCPQMPRHHSSSCFCSYVTSSTRPFLPAPHKCLPVVVHSALTLVYFCLQPCLHLPGGLCTLPDCSAPSKKPAQEQTHFTRSAPSSSFSA